MNTIYTDGHSKDVTNEQAERLLSLGLVEPHPGVGLFGIVEGDLRLASDATWDEIEDAMRDGASDV